MIIIIDWLNKDVIIKFLKDATVEMMIWMFIENILVLYKLLNIIISDRGSQFISDF